MYIKDITIQGDTTMIKVYHCYLKHSRLERLMAANTNVIVFISGLVGKLAENLAFIILHTVAIAIPLAIWLGIPTAIAVCFDGPVDTQWKAFAILGAFTAWTVLCFLVLLYLDRPGKPTSKKH